METPFKTRAPRTVRDHIHTQAGCGGPKGSMRGGRGLQLETPTEFHFSFVQGPTFLRQKTRAPSPLRAGLEK